MTRQVPGEIEQDIAAKHRAALRWIAMIAGALFIALIVIFGLNSLRKWATSDSSPQTQQEEAGSSAPSTSTQVQADPQATAPASSPATAPGSAAQPPADQVGRQQANLTPGLIDTISGSKMWSDGEMQLLLLIAAIAALLALFAGWSPWMAIAIVMVGILTSAWWFNVRNEPGWAGISLIDPSTWGVSAALIAAIIVGTLLFAFKWGVPRALAAAAATFLIVAYAWPKYYESSGGLYPRTASLSPRASDTCPADPQVVTLEGFEEVVINPNGRCFVRWTFDGSIDIINARGNVREGITGTDFIHGFWTESVRSHTGETVVMNYTLSAS